MVRILILFLAVSGPAVAQQVGVGRFESAGDGPVNSWWVPTANGRLLVFDAQRDRPSALSAIAAIRATGRDVAAIIVTHPHPDHVAGLAAFTEAFPDADLVAQAPTAAELAADSEGLLAELGPLPTPDRIIPEGRQTLTLDGTGDLATRGHVPFLAEARTEAWLRQVTAAADLLPADTLALPGHGDPAPRGELVAGMRRYLEDVRTRVTAAIDPASDGGAQITRSERATLIAALEQTHGTTTGVAGVPLEKLWDWNLEAVARELSGGEPGFRAAP